MKQGLTTMGAAIRLWLIFKLWPNEGFAVTGERVTRTVRLEGSEFTLTFQPVGYIDLSREDMVRLLRQIRLNEERQQWKCPEPLRTAHGRVV